MTSLEHSALEWKIEVQNLVLKTNPRAHHSTLVTGGQGRNESRDRTDESGSSSSMQLAIAEQLWPQLYDWLLRESMEASRRTCLSPSSLPAFTCCCSWGVTANREWASALSKGRYGEVGTRYCCSFPGNLLLPLPLDFSSDPHAPVFQVDL